MRDLVGLWPESSFRYSIEVCCRWDLDVGLYVFIIIYSELACREYIEPVELADGYALALFKVHVRLFATARKSDLAGACIAAGFGRDRDDPHLVWCYSIDRSHCLHHIALGRSTGDIKGIHTLPLMHTRFFRDARVSEDGRDVPS